MPSSFHDGIVIVALIIADFLVSGKIRGVESRLGTPHFVIGIAIVTLYIIQVFIGLSVLL